MVMIDFMQTVDKFIDDYKTTDWKSAHFNAAHEVS